MPAIIIACGIARDISVGSSLVSDVFPVAAYLNLCQPVLCICMTLSVYLIWGGDASVVDSVIITLDPYHYLLKRKN